MAHRSTTINLMNRFCPQALKFHLEGRKRDREVFAVGIAAHAVLQGISDTKATREDWQGVAAMITQLLMEEGRWFDGVQEPPLSPEAAILGRDIALSHLEYEGELPEGKAEYPLGMCKLGAAENYQVAYYRAAIDLVYECQEGDEDYSYTVGVVRGYKTASTTNAAGLDELQSKGQAVLLWVNNPDEYQAIRQEIVNLRTGECFSRTIMLDEAGIALLEQWRKDILSACRAAEKPLVARPGANCAGCPYILSCNDSFIASIDYNEKDPNAVCNAYAATRARLEELDRLARKFCEDSNVPVPGGTVGFFPETKRKPITDIHEVLFDYWAQTQGGDWDSYRPSILSFVKALKLNSGNVDALAKTLFPKRAEKGSRKDFVDGCLTDKSVSRFGVSRY